MRVVPFLLVVLLLLASCGTGESEPELSESVVGIWESPNGFFVEFREDGTYDVGAPVGTGNSEWGTWSAEGDVLTQVADDDSPLCARIPGIYEITVLDDGARLDATAQDDECDIRRQDFGNILVRYSGDGS